MKRFLFCLCACCFLWTAAMAQRTVSGVVTDDSGMPLIGATVQERGATTGTATDVDGKFSLSVSGDNAVLLVSYTGYQTTEVAVNGRNTVEVVLAEETELLQEVVVTALGFTQKKDEMGSTYSVVNKDDIVRSGEATLLNSLGAKAAGVQIQRSNGDPGAGSLIRIRGANTISGSSSPLIIVDGIPVSNSAIYGGGNDISGDRSGGVSQQSRINDINPNDIESVQILKGASAASLWGSRAANGVIVITTKNGKSGKPKISFKTTRSFDQVSERYPMQNTYGQGTGGNYSPTSAESWGDYIPDRAGGADEVNTSGQYFEAEDGTKYYPITTRNSKDTYVDENWDAVFQTGGF